MNIDMTIDYDKLLEDAKRRWEKVLELHRDADNMWSNRNANKYWSAHNKYLDERKKFLEWEKENVKKLGVQLLTDFNDGTPIGIKAILSGRDHFNFGGTSNGH